MLVNRVHQLKALGNKIKFSGHCATAINTPKAKCELSYDNRSKLIAHCSALIGLGQRLEPFCKAVIQGIWAIAPTPVST